MATPVPLDTIWQYRIGYTYFGQRLLTTYNLQMFNSSPPITDYENRASGFLTFQGGITGVIDKVRACLGIQVRVDYHEIQPVHSTRLRAVRQNIDNDGLQDDPPMPTNVAQVITKTSVNATRWGIGSVHLPPPATTALNPVGGKWNAIQFGLLNTVALHISNPWLSTILTDIWRPVLWSRANPLRVTEITSAAVQDTPRVERRRTVGLGK